jgi:uncharacterized membrane protein YkvA (DUF1232 family)
LRSFCAAEIMIGRPVDIDLDLEPRERKTMGGSSFGSGANEAATQAKIKLKKIELPERDDAVSVSIQAGGAVSEDAKKKKTCVGKLKLWAKSLKRTLGILIIALRHPECPYLARALGWFTVIYALSPIDLIPDCIPVLGYLDDLIIVPVGIYLTCKLIPKKVWEDSEKIYKEEQRSKPSKDWRGAVFVVFIWLVTGYWFIKMIFLR